MTEQTTPAPAAQPIPLPADAPVYRPGEDEAEDAAWIDGWNEGYRRGYDAARQLTPKRQAVIASVGAAWASLNHAPDTYPTVEAISAAAPDLLEALRQLEALQDEDEDRRMAAPFD